MAVEELVRVRLIFAPVHLTKGHRIGLAIRLKTV
jgi:hypothetical protein